MPVRVLILAAEYPHHVKDKDGIFIQDQAMALNRAGVRADVAFVEPRSIRSLSLAALGENHFQTSATEERGVFTLRMKGWNPWMNSLTGGVAYARLTALLAGGYLRRYGRPDLVHAHNTFWAGYAAHQLMLKHRIPYLITEHSSRFVLDSVTDEMAPYARKVLSGACAALGVSGAVASALNRHGAPGAQVVPNVVDTDFFTMPPKERQRYPFTFLAIGNMNYNKGFHVLLRAFASRFKGRRDVRLVLGGEGPQRLEFQQLAGELGLQEAVHFTGGLGRNEVREEIWRANALILPSFRETFGVVLIEALSTGIPVIATRSGGPQDVVTPDVGILCEPGQEGELAEAMASLMERSFRPEELRAAAVATYSEAALVRRLVSTYRSVLHQGD